MMTKRMLLALFCVAACGGGSSSTETVSAPTVTPAPKNGPSNTDPVVTNGGGNVDMSTAACTPSENDQCDGDNLVYCSADTLKLEEKPCSHGCANGACKDAPPADMAAGLSCTALAACCASDTGDQQQTCLGYVEAAHNSESNCLAALALAKQNGICAN